MVVAVRIVDPVVELCLEGEGKPVPVLHEEMVKLVLLPHKEEGKPVLVLQEEALKLVLLCRKEEGLLVLDSRELVGRQLKELPTKAGRLIISAHTAEWRIMDLEEGKGERVELEKSSRDGGE